MEFCGFCLGRHLFKLLLKNTQLKIAKGEAKKIFVKWIYFEYNLNAVLFFWMNRNIDVQCGNICVHLIWASHDDAEAQAFLKLEPNDERQSQNRLWLSSIWIEFLNCLHRIWLCIELFFPSLSPANFNTNLSIVFSLQSLPQIVSICSFCRRHFSVVQAIIEFRWHVADGLLLF